MKLEERNIEQKRRALRVCAVAAALGLGLFLILLLQPPCLILRLTGLRCAGCGGSRMFSLLLQGKWSEAFLQNQYLFFAVPLLAGYAIWEAARYLRQKPPLFRDKWAKLFLLVVLGAAVPFAIFRNL